MFVNSVKKILILFFCYLFVVCDAFAVFKGSRGESSFDVTEEKCSVGNLDFDPFSSNRDIEWVLNNPHCIGFIAGAGAGIFAAEIASSIACDKAHKTAEISLQHASGVPMSPAMIKRRVQETSTCATLIAAQNYAKAAWCCGSLGVTVTTTGIATGALAALWDVADSAFKNARICGHGWNSWESVTEGQKTYWRTKKGSYRQCLEDAFVDGTTSCTYAGDAITIDKNTNISNKHYREYIYGGREFFDVGSDACKNPWSPVRPSPNELSEREKKLGYNNENQAYYMTGPGAPAIYACHRFRLSARNNPEVREAFECCKRRSQSTICIDSGSAFNSYDYNFCSVGSKCKVADVTFEVYESRQQAGYVCAKTFSVCPYNHLLGGGTEEKEMRTDDPSLVKNFCQYLKHCTKVPLLPYVRNRDLDGAFIAQSCRDMKGDSQNTYGYSAELLPINNRHFSAPLAQCFKETMENIFLHKAGYTKCKNPDEEPDENDECVSGYDDPGQKKGQDLPGDSFFSKIQNNLQSFIKMCLTFAIVAFGFAILMAVPSAYIEKKKLLPFIIKIGLVLYFAAGDAWQTMFMQGVLGSSSYLSNMVFMIDQPKTDSGSPDYSRLDGCQFPRRDYSDSNEETRYNNPAYPPGKEYLALWDTLDCKISRALGFGPEVSVPNLIFMILGGFITPGISGIIFVVGTFVFAFCLISVTVRALHVFLMSTTLIVLLIYVSPITITAALFARTNGIFDKWWKKLLGQVLQPILLFLYLGFFIVVFDNIMIGSDVRFNPALISRSDGSTYSDNLGAVAQKSIDCRTRTVNGVELKPRETSIYCIFRIADIKTMNALAPLGVGLPMLASMNDAKLQTIIKAALIMYIMFSFMDQVASLQLFGDSADPLSSDWKTNLASKSLSTLKGVRERGMNLALKAGDGVVRKGISGANAVVNKLGNKGKSVASEKASTQSADMGAGKKGDGDMAASSERSSSGDMGGGSAKPSGGDMGGGSPSRSSGDAASGTPKDKS